MTPDEKDRIRKALPEGLAARLDFVLSDANPFFRAAKQIAQGTSSADALADSLYAGRTKIEARQWLKAGLQAKQPRFVHVYSPRKTAQLVEELYRAGAKIVWAVDPVPTRATYTADVLLVALPDESSSRHALAVIHEREMAKVWCNEPDEEVAVPAGNSLLFQYT